LTYYSNGAAENPKRQTHRKVGTQNHGSAIADCQTAEGKKTFGFLFLKSFL
jgi:hypothetical protein